MKRWIGILVVILVSIIAFFGIYQKENGVWKKVIPDYQYGMDIKGARELIYTPSENEEEKYVYVDEAGNIKGEVWKDGSAVTEEDQAQEETTDTEETEQEEVPYAKETRTIKENPDDTLTKENFEQAKKMIQKRLKEQGLNEYHIRIDDVTGKLEIENANKDEEIELIEQLISNSGKLKIVDHQNGVVLMDNSDIKNVSVVFSNDETYSTYLQIQFNKEGTQKLKDISNQYVEIKNETENTEKTEDEEQETEKKYVSIVFDDTTMMTTYFGEEMAGGVLQISVGQARTDYEEFRKDYDSAKTIADILNSGVLPVTYELETDNFVKSEITDSIQNTMKIVAIIGIIIISLIYLMKFKKDGVIGAILNIGYLAILSLILKYTNVEITVNSMITVAIMVIFNVIFIGMILKELQTKPINLAYQKASKMFYLSLIPVIVLALVFTLTKYYAINSIGMVAFWGIILNVLYNLIFTKTVLDNRKD